MTQFRFKSGPSFLDNLSMHELIGNDDKEYIKIIMNLYVKRILLKKLKDKLVIQREKNKIFNSEFYVKQLEKLYISNMD